MCCDTVDQTDNCSSTCQFTLVFSVQPYEATALDVEFPLGQPEYMSDKIPMFAQGTNVFPEIRSNPYTVELETWTVSNDG